MLLPSQKPTSTAPIMSDSTLPSLGLEAIPDHSSLSALEVHTAPPASLLVHVASPHSLRCSPLKAVLPILQRRLWLPHLSAPRRGGQGQQSPLTCSPSLCAALAWLPVKAPRLQISQEHSSGDSPPGAGWTSMFYPRPAIRREDSKLASTRDGGGG